MGIRACERLTGLNRRTVLGILERAGEHYPETPGLFDNPADWEEPKD
jgi:transposase-like protein